MVEIKQMMTDGSIIDVPSGTKLLVRYPVPVGRFEAIYARILDGEHKEKLAWIYAPYVAKMIEKPADPKPSPKPTPKPIDPAVRAATLLQSAKNLEKAGKLKPATGEYRRIVKDFPETPSAKAASARLKELGVK